MKSKTLNLTSWQAVAASEKRLHRIIVPMKIQPHHKFHPSPCQVYEPTRFTKIGEMYPGKPIFGCYDLSRRDEGYECPFLKCPFSVGDVVGLREAWTMEPGVDGESACFCEYQADGYCYTRNWNSPSSMPSWAIRHHFHVKSIEAKKLGFIIDTLETAYVWNLRLPQKWSPDLWVWSIGGEVKA